MEEASAAYHVPLGLRLEGELDDAALSRALDRLVARHEVLRTTFVSVDGEPMQRIGPAERGFGLRRQDLSGTADAEAALEALAAEEASAPFDLEAGPLIRGQLVRMGPADHVLLITLHHIVSDGWSMAILTRELSALYRAFAAGEDDPLAPLEVQYADYAAWQRRWLSGEALAEQSTYWREALEGAPSLLELPTDRRRPARQDYSGDAIAFELDEALTAQLKALSLRHGMTLFMTLAGGLGRVVLSRRPVGPGRGGDRRAQRPTARHADRGRGPHRLLRQHPGAAGRPLRRPQRVGAAAAKVQAAMALGAQARTRTCRSSRSSKLRASRAQPRRLQPDLPGDVFDLAEQPRARRTLDLPGWTSRLASQARLRLPRSGPSSTSTLGTLHERDSCNRRRCDRPTRPTPVRSRDGGADRRLSAPSA